MIEQVDPTTQIVPTSSTDGSYIVNNSRSNHVVSARSALVRLQQSSSDGMLLMNSNGNIRVIPLKDVSDSISESKSSAINHANTKHNAAINHANTKHNAAINHANTKQPKGDYVKINDRIRITNDKKGCRWLKLKGDGAPIEANHGGSCGYSDPANYNRSLWRIVRG